MRNDFNLIARIYDFGVRVIFGGAVERSYNFFLEEIKKTDKVLIVGGGTGQQLHHISPSCEIDYVDQSRQMIQLAQRHQKKNIRFFEIDFFDFKDTGRYDWIVFPYFLDLFEEDEVADICKVAGSMLKQKGKFLISDFTLPRTIFQKALISLIIWSLRPVLKLQITTLPSIQSVLLDAGYEPLALKEWRDGFIFSGIYHQRETF